MNKTITFLLLEFYRTLLSLRQGANTPMKASLTVQLASTAPRERQTEEKRSSFRSLS